LRQLFDRTSAGCHWISQSWISKTVTEKAESWQKVVGFVFFGGVDLYLPAYINGIILPSRGRIAVTSTVHRKKFGFFPVFI